MNKVEKVILWNYVVISLLVLTTAQSDFSYSNTKPDYIVGQQITSNNPLIEIDGGEFTIKPAFSKGLSLDLATGVITGTPTEEYQAVFTVTYTKTDGIWDKPTISSCGFTKLNIIDSLTDSFECKSDKKVKSWSISFIPEGSYGISISNDGILKFSNYNPIDELKLTIKAINPASESGTAHTIVISKISFEYKSGMNIDVDDVNEFSCGSSEITNIYYSTSTIIDDLDGLDGENAYNIWDEKLGGFLSSHNTEYWNYTINAIVNVEKDNSMYVIHTNSDYSKFSICFDTTNCVNANSGGEAYDYELSKYVKTYCSLWEKSYSDSYIALNAGYHDVKITGIYSKHQQNCLSSNNQKYECSDIYNSSYQMKLTWNIFKETESSIPFLQAKTPYKPVAFLSFDSDFYTVPVNTYFEIPFKVGRGKATDCAGPSATITFDMSRNIMKGTIPFAVAMPVTVFCKTTTSTTNTVSLTIKGVSQYVKGIVGYYLKSDNFDDTCLTPYTPSTDNVNTEIIRLEDGINHPYESSQSVWKGLTPNFASEFGVNWEGYLKIDADDSYTFNLSSVYGSWLSIDYKEIINHKGNHEWSSITKTIDLTSGYHFIRVNYMKYIGESGITLTMKQGENDEFKEMNNNLYFVPRGDFEYSTSYAIYIRNEMIDDNIPRIHEGGSVSECISDPTLPANLELTDDCTIRGTPMSISDIKSYVITGKMNDGKSASATIQIRIIESTKPQGIHLVDLDNTGLIYTDSINIFLGNETHLAIEVDSGFPLYYEFAITPEGFVLDKYTATLTVVARETLTNYELIINAFYEGSNTPISKTILVSVISGCLGDERTVFFKLENDLAKRTGDFKYQFKNYNSSSITNEIIIPEGNLPIYSQSFCLVPGNYKFTIKDENFYTYGNNYISFYTNGKLVDYLTTRNTESGTYDINTEIKGPTVEYGNIRNEYYLNDVISLIPRTKLLESCEISPQLPSCLFFNTSTCGITGTVNESSPNTEYTITARGLNDITTKVFNITLYDESIKQSCMKRGDSLITVSLTTSLYASDHPENWVYSLYKTSEINNDNKESLIQLVGLDQGWESSKDYSYDYCLPEDNYTSEYTGTEKYGYKYGFFDVSVNGIPVTRRSLTRDEYEGTDSFNGISDYNYNTQWEYSSQYEEGWDNIDKASGLWRKAKLSDIGSIAGNVVYIRKIDSFTNLDRYNAFSIKVSYISGIIVKVNGKEIFRNNLPNGEITPDTKANNIFDDLTDEIFLLPLTWLEEEKVIIAIELHKYENENNFPQINTNLLRIIGSEQDCLILNKYTNPVTESNTGSGIYHAKYGFDENSNTEWSGTTIPAWAIMRYKDHIHSYFNQFSIATVSTSYKTPQDILLEGYVDNNWIEITTFKDIEFPDGKKRVFTNYNMSSMYTAIRFTVTKSNSNGIEVYDVNFNLCPFRYCKAVADSLLPETPTGTEVKVSCKNPSIPGERTFYCGNDLKWIEQNSTCAEEPTVISQEEKYEFKAGNSYKDISLFKVSGKDVSYSMTPIIEGLELNETTGLINGKPYKEQQEQSVYFKITNPYTTTGITIEIKITVLPSEKPILIWKNESIILDAGINYNDYRLFYVTGTNITYSIDQLPNGLSLNKDSGLISGISLEETSMECRVTAKNQYEIYFTIVINITLPESPVNIVYEKNVNVIFGMNYTSLKPYQCVGKTITYSVEPKLPDGLDIDGYTGIISGKINIEPPSDITYTFTCSNAKGQIPNKITIHVEESIEPVIITHIDSFTIEGGNEYEEIILGRITGKNLIYKITPSLPSSETLKFDVSKGTISGYITTKFDSMSLTLTASGNGKQVSFAFTLLCSIPTHPVVIPSTKVPSISFDFGNTIKTTYLFIAVGTNIHVTVTPELPKGMTLDKDTGAIYGNPTVYVEKTKYTFVISNLPSPIIETVEVEIGFNAIYCEADSGFPKTPAEKGGREVTIKCGGGKSGMKIRKCLLTDTNTGKWSEVDDSDCAISGGAIAGIAIGSVAGGLIIIVVVSLCLLRTGVFRKRARSQSIVKRGSLHQIVDIPEKDLPEGVRV